jgi:NAD(P)-dependent dehydrogenase (short-subunit alcohol dehydrogenase family)
MINLKNKVILITGAGGSIGSYLSEKLEKTGCKLILFDNDKKKLISLKKKLSKNFFIVDCDLRNRSKIEFFCNLINKKYKKIDVLIHSASPVGTSDLQGWNTEFKKQNIDNWDISYNLNVTVLFFLVQKLYNLLQKSKSASIINFGSIYSECSPKNNIYKNTKIFNPAGYSCSKSASLYLTKWLASTLGPKIRCNMISPGGLKGAQGKLFIKNYSKEVPLKRMTNLNDLIGPVIFLSSEMSNYITGQNIFVDGGFSIK